MSTQEDVGFPVALNDAQQNFRLMELPAALLELLDSSNPPMLSIKSEDPPSATSDKQAYAVLCTPSKTYQIRQVQTSNTVYVTEPALLYPSENPIPEPGIRAIGTCSTTLELHESTNTPRSILAKLIPLYHGPSGDGDGDLDMASAGQSTMHAIFADIPFSDGECAREWINLVAFESERGCFRPTARCLAGLWKCIVDASLAEALNLEQQFLVDELWKTIQDDGYPKPLVVAMLRRLQAGAEGTDEQWASVDPSKCIPWLGETLLAANASADTGMATEEFLDLWKNALPENWRAMVQLQDIEAVSSKPNPFRIRFRDPHSAETKTGAAKPGGNRKWHEKFKKTRG